MNNKIYSLDSVRVVAIFMILLCHYFLFSYLNDGVGRYFAGVGNMVFFLVSAMLYGLKYNNDNQCVDYKKFIKGRIIRLGAPTWTFLVILIILYLIFKIPFSWFDAGLNFMFLGYLGNLPGNGHLWFLTVLVACYAEMLPLLRMKIKSQNAPWIILVTSVMVLILGERFGIPSIAFLTLGFFGFVFLKSDWFLQKSKSMKWWMAAAIVTINIACFIFEYNGLFIKSRSAHFLLTGLCGLLLLSLMIRYIPNRSNRMISFICGISFEIYLVHYTLCAGPFIAITHWPMPHIVNFCALVVFSIILATLLRMLVKRQMFFNGQR